MNRIKNLKRGIIFAVLCTLLFSPTLAAPRAQGMEPQKVYVSFSGPISSDQFGDLYYPVLYGWPNNPEIKLEVWNVGSAGGSQYALATMVIRIPTWTGATDQFTGYSEIITQGTFTGGPNGVVNMPVKWCVASWNYGLSEGECLTAYWCSSTQDELHFVDGQKVTYDSRYHCVCNGCQPIDQTLGALELTVENPEAFIIEEAPTEEPTIPADQEQPAIPPDAPETTDNPGRSAIGVGAIIIGILGVAAGAVGIAIGVLGGAATAAGVAATLGMEPDAPAVVLGMRPATSVAATGRPPAPLQDPAAELETYPVPTDDHKKTAQNLKNSIPPRVLDLLTRGAWKGLDDEERKKVVKYLIWQMGKQMEIGKVKVKWREKGDKFQYAGQAFSDKVPPEIKINDWSPTVWDQPGELLDTLAHEMRHLQQSSEESMMENADVKALATYNKWKYNKYEGDTDKYYDQFNERDSRSMARNVSNELSGQAYKQKLEKMEAFYKSTMQGGRSNREVRTSALDGMLEKHPELRSRVSQLIKEGKLKVVE